MGSTGKGKGRGNGYKVIRKVQKERRDVGRSIYVQ